MTGGESWPAGLAHRIGAASAALVPGRLSVLIFHRVMPERDPLFPEEMHAERFDRLMGQLARSFRVLPLGEALTAMDAGRLPMGALSVTFDDGYADNAEVALPILRRHGLRATFFVATGFLDGGRMFNDSVIEILRHARGDTIDLDGFGLGRLPLTGAAQRRAAVDRLLPTVKYLALEQRESAIAELSRAAGSPSLPRDLMMRSAQVQELHRAGMEIGGHTVRHPILRVLPDPEARAEIAGGRDALQALIDAPVEVFAYPNGVPGQDYDERHVAMVRELGFRAAVSTRAGTAGPASDRFQMPRFTPWDESPARWMARLAVERWRSIVAPS